MQYQVPQFIETEDRIIGPLTLKQFLYLAFAAAVLFVFWFIFNIYIWILVAIPVSAAAAAFAFVKINDRPFAYYFLAFVRYFTIPKLYIFSSAPITPPELGETAATEIPEIKKEAAPPAGGAATGMFPATEPEEKITYSKLKELALKLDAGK